MPTLTFGHGFVTKLSSAGLVYKHFGREIVARVLEFPVEDPRVEKIYLKVYKSFIEAVDGIDNGVNMWESDKPAKYADNTGLSARVGKLNPAWNEDFSAASQMTQFHKAMATAVGLAFFTTIFFAKSKRQLMTGMYPF